jgi:hypothetical protein
MMMMKVILMMTDDNCDSNLIFIFSYHLYIYIIIFHLYHILEKDVMETYRENAMKLFSTLMDDVRRNTVYSLFIYKPNRK